MWTSINLEVLKANANIRQSINVISNTMACGWSNRLVPVFIFENDYAALPGE